MKNLPSIIQAKLPNTITKTLLLIVASRAHRVHCKMIHSFVVKKIRYYAFTPCFPFQISLIRQTYDVSLVFIIGCLVKALQCSFFWAGNARLGNKLKQLIYQM
jgi:hypothetical protein